MMKSLCATSLYLLITALTFVNGNQFTNNNTLQSAAMGGQCMGGRLDIVQSLSEPTSGLGLFDCNSQEALSFQYSPFGPSFFVTGTDGTVCAISLGSLELAASQDTDLVIAECIRPDLGVQIWFATDDSRIHLNTETGPCITLPQSTTNGLIQQLIVSTCVGSVEEQWIPS